MKRTAALCARQKDTQLTINEHKLGVVANTGSNDGDPPMTRRVPILRLCMGYGYFVTLMSRVTLMAVKPGYAGEDSRRVKVPLFLPGFNTARTWTRSPW